MSDTHMNDGGDTRGRVDQGMAEQVVGENLDLGLSADDLGINRDDVFADLDLDNDPNLGADDFDNLSTENNNNNNNQQQNVQPQNNQQQQRQQQQQPQRQQQQSQMPQYALVKPDGKGNLVDANGQIVARAGAESRHYSKFAKHFEAPLRAAAQRLADGGRVNQDLNGRLTQAIEVGNQLVAKVRELSAQVNQPGMEAQFGLSKDELIQAATFAKQAKSDPASAIRSLLTMAAARGIDLKSVLGPNAPQGGFDMKVITDLIQGEIGKAIKPLNDRTAVEQQREQEQRDFQQAVLNIQNEARDFFSRNQDAVPFLEAFRQIKTDPNLRHLSMDHIWSEIRLRLAQGGHTPQSYMQAVRGRQQQQNGGTMPSGRQRGTYVPPDNRSNDTGMAPVSTSYEDIVRDLLRST